MIVAEIISSWNAATFPDHTAKLHDTPDEYLAEAMPIAKKIAGALGAENYNILQVWVTSLSVHILVLIESLALRNRTTAVSHTRYPPLFLLGATPPYYSLLTKSQSTIQLTPPYPCQNPN